MCRKQPGIAIGRVCEKCDGKCPVCDSYVRPTTLVRICDECSFGNYQNKCVVCGGEGISDAFYCFECTRLEKDRDGCPKIINLGSSRTDVSRVAAAATHMYRMLTLHSSSTKRKQIGHKHTNTRPARIWADGKTGTGSFICAHSCPHACDREPQPRYKTDRSLGFMFLNFIFFR